jgi:hypothetical protein
MDPYLEDPDVWPDFHTCFMVAVRMAIGELLPERYAIGVERHVWLYDAEADRINLLGRPDIYTFDAGQTLAQETQPADTAVGLPAAPTVVRLPVVREEGKAYLRIIDRRRRRVVTVIELLSPANKKPGEDRDACFAKRTEYLALDTNLVEIDLLRSGRRPMLGEPPLPNSDYYVFVCREREFPTAGVWPFTIRDSFPPLAVPLSADDGEVVVDLKSCFDRTFDGGGCRKEINYREPPATPLNPPDDDWARALLAAS